MQTIKQNCNNYETCSAVLEVMFTSVQHNNCEREGWVVVVEVERRH